MRREMAHLIQLSFAMQFLFLSALEDDFSLLQYFVFDFHMPPMMLFDKIITLSVSFS
jgi:hypothetical protein